MVHQGEHDAAESPDVNLLVNPIPLEQVYLLGCPVYWRRDLFDFLGDCLSILLCQRLIILFLRTAAKIAYLPFSVVAFHNILNLQISMRNFPLMKIAKPIGDVVNDLQ